jgi:hypothetical protein
MSTGCSDPNFCRGGCCRNFFGKQFCDIESNCVAAPTWIVALVPALLGVAAIVLIIIVVMRLKNRKVIENYDRVGNVDHEGYATVYLGKLCRSVRNKVRRIWIVIVLFGVVGDASLFLSDFVGY